MTTSDTTIIGNGGSPYATESHPGPVPMHRIRDLFNYDAEYAPIYTITDGTPTTVPNRHAIVRARVEVFKGEEHVRPFVTGEGRILHRQQRPLGLGHSFVFRSPHRQIGKHT